MSYPVVPERAIPGVSAYPAVPLRSIPGWSGVPAAPSILILVAAPDSAVNHIDRALWMTSPFDFDWPVLAASTTPASRTYNVPSDSRTYNVPADSRTYNAPADSRTYNVPS